MSVALTTEQVKARQKTVTRRAGWTVLKPGDLLTLCPKVRGRRAGEPLERIVTVEVVSTRRERLDSITPEDVIAEGFPEMTPAQFIDFFAATHRGVTASTEITRIQWQYPRECRGCGCTDYQACDTLHGPCAWQATYDDHTGICTACRLPENGPNGPAEHPNRDQDLKHFVGQANYGI
ncbi:hypothetical protein [Rhodococcus erythropolis]|uniref:hypothetical protein n=1 Tax=Rhodococcus erythropolis TaxID=1833 RepID=UPI0021BE05AE|nr:hypothetical protein [Rhodococcus erythropolis]